MRLARLLWLAKSRDTGFARRLRAMQANAENYVVGILAHAGVKVTARRVIRLMDIWAIAHLQPAADVGVPEAVHQQFQSILDRTQDSQDPGNITSPIWQAILSAAPGRSANAEKVEDEVRKCTDLWFSDQPNIWEDAEEPDFAVQVWQLLNSEAANRYVKSEP